MAERIIGAIIRDEEVGRTDIRVFADELLQEFFGKNVAISSGDESDELLLDLDTMIAAELFQGGIVAEGKRPLVSFWSDWDGSNRPSGQGHRLVGTALVANVTRMSHLLSVVVESVGRRPESLGGDTVDRTLLKEIRLLPKQRKRFALLLNRITQLTHQLEKRYRGVLPFSVKPGVLRNLGMKLRIARDPLTLLWRHNDRLERRMVALRAERRQSLEYYFSLNKRLRKQLHALLPAMGRQTVNERLVVEAGLYADLLQRMVVTPRIHENMITAQDSFAIDTTVHNIYEINEIAARYGNPGIILALQVSMSTRAEVLIALARKIRARHEQTLRNDPERELPVVRLIPLFEDVDAIDSIPTYLQKIWDYAYQSRHIDQETKDRFAEIIAEVFIAGSDISQQVGQAAGAMAYRKAKQKTVVWLAEHDLIDRVRVKMGSGEPMQRQGGYYAPLSGKPAFDLAWERLPQSLPAAARKSAQYATTPLMGVFAGSDLRTLQSTVSEQLRYLPAQDLVQLLHHLRESQQQQRTDLVRGAEALVESRIKVHNKGAQQLDRLTIGATDSVYEQFTGMVTEDFRQILYGRDEDVVGIHVISYFIARAMPQLRDRPTVRPTSRTDAERGQKILGQIAKMIPLSRRGSLVRAIAHNHAQTLVLGVNQLTTGLFRALQRFSQREFQEGNAEMLILDRILPQLPVYEILHSLRLYHDPELRWLKQMESAFPAGSAALLALSEDHDNLRRYVNLFQQELLRRHGLDVGDFFDEGLFRTDLLPFLRPDLAILLQHDLFNTNADAMLKHVRMPVRSSWKASVAHQLRIPDEIRALREQIWSLLKQPIYERVQSFAELAVALHSLSSTAGVEHAAVRSSRVQLSEELWHFFKSEKQNDEMRDFLASTLRYLSALSEGMIEVPVSIIRSMNEVERIAKIEEQALSEREHELLTFYALQIARLSGDNG